MKTASKFTQTRLIAVLIATGVPKQDIAKILDTVPSTISQRIKRDTHGISQMIKNYKKYVKVPITEVHLKGEA